MSQVTLNCLSTIQQKLGGSLVINQKSAVLKIRGKEITLKVAKKSVSLTHDCSEEFLIKHNIYNEFASLNMSL